MDIHSPLEKGDETRCPGESASPILVAAPSINVNYTAYMYVHVCLQSPDV